MSYRIFRSNNYFVLIDKQGNYFEEECENVLVTKKEEKSKTYDIAFLRQETESIRNLSYSFPDIPFSDITNEDGVPYPSLTAWETFYQQNTGAGSIAFAIKTPKSFVTSGTHEIPAGATEISIFNNGTGDAIVNGTKIPAGVTRTFGFKNPTSTIIVCDGGGTEELIIDYML